MIYMLDTNILRHYVQDVEKAPVIVGHIERIGIKNIVVSAIAANELMIAMLNDKLTKTVRNDLAVLLSRFHVLPFDERAAFEAAHIEHELRAVGQVIGKSDTLIAGHARGLGFTVVTNNTREFRRIEGLAVSNWLA